MTSKVRIRDKILTRAEACELLSRPGMAPTPRELETIFSDGAVRPKVEIIAMLKLRGKPTEGKSYRELQRAFIDEREQVITESYQASLPTLRRIFGGMGL